MCNTCHRLRTAAGLQCTLSGCGSKRERGADPVKACRIEPHAVRAKPAWDRTWDLGGCRHRHTALTIPHGTALAAQRSQLVPRPQRRHGLVTQSGAQSWSKVAACFASLVLSVWALSSDLGHRGATCWRASGQAGSQPGRARDVPLCYDPTFIGLQV